MSFDRHAVQQYFEAKFGCRDIARWPLYKAHLRDYELTAEDVFLLSPLLLQDAVALYIKALQSFTQALTALQRKEFAWPIVKMYYSVFYSMRSELHASNIITVKNGSLFYSANKEGNRFSSKQEKGSHQTYIKLRAGMPTSVISHDKLLDNNIEPDMDVYTWMCDNRERVNYRAKYFSDPNPDNLLQKIFDNYISKGMLNELFNLYESEFLFCFDFDHATVAAPYWKLHSCKDLLLEKVTLSTEEQAKIDSVRNQLRAAHIELAAINRIVL